MATKIFPHQIGRETDDETETKPLPIKIESMNKDRLIGSNSHRDNVSRTLLQGQTISEENKLVARIMTKTCLKVHDFQRSGLGNFFGIFLIIHRKNVAEE